MALQPNEHLIRAIISSVTASISSAGASDIQGSADPRTELDSHANMIVLGKHAFVFESTGRTCNVQPFASELGIATNVPIVDGALAYDCPYTRQTVVLLVRNALHIPSMTNNLIPPFIMRAGGLIVNDVPKIHCTDPTIDDHCIKFREKDLRIPLQLYGTFSYFHSRLPTIRELHDCDKYFISPDASDWNPHCRSFEMNERAMLNYEGELVSDDRRSNLPMSRDDENEDIFELASVSVDEWERQVDVNISSAYVPPVVDLHCDRADSLDDSFSEALNLRGDVSKMSGSVGSCNLGIDDQCSLFEGGPMTTTLDNLEESLSSILGPDQLQDVMATISAAEAGKPKGVTPAHLSKLWFVSEKLAEGAIEQNTQLCRHNADNILSRQFSTNDRMLRYRRLESAFFTDTMFATKRATSTRGNKACQVFVSDKGFVAVYPMQSAKDFDTALHWFCKQVGVPVSLVCDPYSSQTSYDVKRFCDQVGTTLRVLEKSTQWANRAELYIGLLKEAVRKDMRSSHSPMVLWDYAIERRAMIHNAIPRALFQANGLSPHAATFGVQGDISNICVFGWYEWVYYRDHGTFPMNKEKLGRVLGPLRNEGNEMAQAVLTSKGTVVPRRTLRRLTVAELHSEVEKRKRSVFDDIIKSKMGDSMSFPPKSKAKDHVPYSDDTDPDPPELPSDSDPVDKDGVALFEKPLTDVWINAEINLPQGEAMQSAKVIGRAMDEDGNLIGRYDDNPILNTMVYNVEFPDGDIREYSANVIAENMYAQVDANGYSHTILESIMDYSKDGTAVERDDMYITTKSGTRRMRQSTVGWKLLVLWKDGSEEWVPLKLLKESNPVEVAEFAISQGIENEPAFAWWVPYTLRRRDKIISAVNARVKKVSHKYGVELPRTVQEAFALDEKNGNTMWRDAINKEMENLKVAFDILPDGRRVPVGYTKASGHLVFDVRMTLERKARWVKDGHRTPEPGWSILMLVLYHVKVCA